MHGVTFLQDLAVVEQAGDPSDLLWGPAVQLALSGHSVLIVPRSWTSPQFGRRALVAWNGSAQAAAAVRKALPLLRRAELVSVLIGHSRASFPATMRPPKLDIVDYLNHQGVSADARGLSDSDADAGAAILKAAAESGADLIVMGAFGRSRFKEWILAGARVARTASGGSLAVPVVESAPAGAIDRGPRRKFPGMRARQVRFSPRSMPRCTVLPPMKPERGRRGSVPTGSPQPASAARSSAFSRSSTIS